MRQRRSFLFFFLMVLAVFALGATWGRVASWSWINHAATQLAGTVVVGGANSGDIATVGAAQTLTNKTIDADNNPVSNLAHGAEVDDPSNDVHGVTGAVVGTQNVQVLLNKTLTSPVLNIGVSGTAVLDEDDMASNSATHLATQQSIRAFVEARAIGTGTFVNNANGNPSASDTSFNVGQRVALSTWESIGPTGSGADNEWAALDSVPSGVDWVELFIHTKGDETVQPNLSLSLQMYMRRTGSAEGVSFPNLVADIWVRTNSSGDGGGTSLSVRKIPVDGSRRFDLHWMNNGFTGVGATLVLTGWGSNP